MSSPVSLLPLFLLPPSVSPPPLFLHLSSTLHLPRAVIILFHVYPHHPTPLTHTHRHTHTHQSCLFCCPRSLSVRPSLLSFYSLTLFLWRPSLSPCLAQLKSQLGYAYFLFLSFSLLYLSLFLSLARRQNIQLIYYRKTNCAAAHNCHEI